MNRKQLYNEITSLGLQKEVQSRYGKNYTTCTNEQLHSVVDSVYKSMKFAKKESTKLNLNPCNCGLNKLVEVLAKKKILLKSEVDAIIQS